MRLKRIELNGFKSFCDKMSISFETTITGIVGPNGCGKSNVLDAVRWVMGEQRMKSLRSQSRSDVIFNGSEKRKEADFAEVTLVLSDIPVEYRPEGFEEVSEIAITRRIDSKGQTNYLLNGQNSRLKDVRTLFTGTGLGRHSYAIIEQGRVNEFLQSSPEQRRLWIEEASGISRYKEQRKEAESRMQQTQTHLDRIGDVLKTLGQQRKSLQRQASKARKYRTLREEIEDLDLYLISHRYLSIWAKQRQLALLLDELSQQQGDLRDQLYTDEIYIQEMESELRAEGEQLQDRREQLQKRLSRLALLSQTREHLHGDIRRLSDRYQQLERENKQNDSHFAQCLAEQDDVMQQRETLALEQGNQDDCLTQTDSQLLEINAALNEAEREIDHLKAEVIEVAKKSATYRNQFQELQRRQHELKTRLEHNGVEQSENAIQCEQMQQQLLDTEKLLEHTQYEREHLVQQDEQMADTQIQLRRDVAEAEREVRQLQDQVSERRARLQSLQELQAEYRDLDEAGRHLMKARDQNKIASEQTLLGPLANWVSPEEKYEKAVASALSEQLQYLVVDEPETALRCIKFLHREQAGRTGFLALSTPPPPPRVSLPKHPAIIGHLLDQIRSPASHRPMFEYLLGGHILVQSLDVVTEHLDLSLFPPHTVWVAFNGDVLANTGIIIGGEQVSSSLGMLQRRRQVKELETQVEKLELMWDEREEHREALQDQLEELIEQRQRQREEIQTLSIKETALSKDLQRIDSDLKRLEERVVMLQREQSRLEQQGQGLDAEITAIEIQLNQINRCYEEQEANLRHKREEIDANRLRQRDILSQLTAIKVEIASRNERLESLRVRAAQLEKRRDHLIEKRDTLRHENEETSSLLQSRTHSLADAESELKQIQGLIDSEEQSVKDQIQKYTEAEQRLTESRQQLEQSRQTLEQLREQRTNHLLEQREAEVQMQALDQETRQRYGFPAGEALPRHHCRPSPHPEDDQRLVNLQQELSRLGEVNLLAEQEFESIDKEYIFLQEQVDDLDKTLASLRRTIQKINQKSRDLFRETFEAIRINFANLFPKLFEGGQADLILTNPDDLLETGIDISVRPPGKRRHNIVLLSGGEKALTTIALIFSFFLYKPSPFCILDEVDAPLDDINIDRYNRLVRELSSCTQFIVITHNKRTMELSDQLYGVTMQEPGVSTIVSVHIEDDIASAA